MKVVGKASVLQNYQNYLITAHFNLAAFVHDFYSKERFRISKDQEGDKNFYVVEEFSQLKIEERWHSL